MNDVKIVNLDKIFNTIFKNAAASAASAASATAARINGFPVPVNAIFNVKTEETVPVLGEDGKPLVQQVPGENGNRSIVKKTVKLENPILASKVFFSDGTWTVVKNSKEDPIELAKAGLSDGSSVETASDASKERAIAYAVIKRLFGRIDPDTKEVKGANLGRRIEEVLSRSVDKRIAAAEAKIAKKPRAEKENGAKNAKRAEKKESAKCASKDEIRDLVKDVMSGLVEALKNGDLGFDFKKDQEGA